MPVKIGRDTIGQSSVCPEIPEGCPRYLDTQMSPLQSTVIVSPWTNRIVIRTAAIPANSVFIDDRELNVERAALVGIRAIHYQSPEQSRHDLQELGVEPH